MEVVLEDNGFKEFIEKYVAKTDVADAANLYAWWKKLGKERREYKTILSQASMGNPHHIQCGRLWRIYSKVAVTVGNWRSKINSGRSRWKRVTPFQRSQKVFPMSGWIWECGNKNRWWWFGDFGSPRTSQELAQLSKLYQWKGKATKLGIIVVGFGVGEV